MSYKKKVLIVAPYTPSLVTFRGDFLRSLVELGYEVIACSPDKDTDGEEKLRELGVSFRQVKLDRQKMNILKDFYYCQQLYSIFKHEKPDISFHYSIKPIIYGTVIAKLFRVSSIVTMLTGLGYAFTDVKGLRHRFVNLTARFMYKLALNLSHIIIFHNEDDVLAFRKLNIINDNHNVAVVNGSGVNTNFFYFQEWSQQAKISFLLIARLLKNKGILEFIEAANIVKRDNPEVDFVVLGPEESGPAALKVSELDLTSITYVGFQKDVRPFLKKTSVFVLPSYREGTPRSVLEAMSMGKPIICSDVPGCRNTVIEGYNGFLIPHKNVEELVKAMKEFIDNPKHIESMGQNSRKFVEEHFEVSIVTQQMLSAMELT